MNELTIIFLLGVILAVGIQWLLTRRHVRHIREHRGRVPAAFIDKIPLDAHQRAADYTQAKVRLGLCDFVLGMVLLLIWTLGGGLDLLDRSWRALDLNELWRGTAVVLSCYAIVALLDLPLSIYRTFVLEERFGFNKTTPVTYVKDIVKNIFLALLIGTPLIVLVIWTIGIAGPYWWVYVWVIWLIFSLLMMWAYPAFIAPLFNKFRPLQNETLRARIDGLLARNGFTSKGIFVMDGSTRSTHGNAYFTGLGSNKRIVFFDTLMDELSHDEIEAVLAHELGHFKCNHVKKRIVTMGLVILAGLALLGWLIGRPWFYHGLGVSEPSGYMALLLFAMISPVFLFFLQPVFSRISRRHEFEADDFAAAQAHSDHLVQALVKLYRENANTLTPDPVYSAFHDSHPPAPVRIAHLSAKA